MSNVHPLPGLADLPDSIIDPERAKAGMTVLDKTATESPGRKPADKQSKKVQAKARTLTLPNRAGIFGDVPDTSVCETTATLPLTRMGLAQRVHFHYGEIIRFRESTNSWWLYRDGVWIESDLYVRHLIRRVIRSISVHECGWAEKKNEEVARLQDRMDALIKGNQEPTKEERDVLHSAKRAARMAHEKYAETCENGAYADKVMGDLAGICVVPESEWDAHPFRINFPNGTINIGKDHRDPETNMPVLYEHDPLHYITMQTAVEYDPEAWSDDLDAIETHMEMSGKGTWKGLTRYLGYGLTGDMLGKTYLNVWSPPDAAKSTLLDAVMDAVGGLANNSYVGVIDPGDLSVGKAEAGKAQAGIDSLRGKRLIFVHEAEHVYLGSDLMKRWTGGDAIRSRTLNSPGGVWQPEGKFVLIGNGPTPFTASDKGMVDRAFIIELKALAPSQIDRQLRYRIKSPEGLKAVLACLIKAACEWYDDNKGGMGARDALCIPEAAEKAKAKALVTINPLTDWIEQALDVGEEDALAAMDDYRNNIGRCTTAMLCESYNRWAKSHGQPAQTPRKFGPLLGTAGMGETFATEFTAYKAWNEKDAFKVKGLIRLGVRMKNRSTWEQIATA